MSASASSGSLGCRISQEIFLWGFSSKLMKSFCKFWKWCFLCWFLFTHQWTDITKLRLSALKHLPFPCLGGHLVLLCKKTKNCGHSSSITHLLSYYPVYAPPFRFCGALCTQSKFSFQSNHWHRSMFSSKSFISVWSYI